MQPEFLNYLPNGVIDEMTREINNYKSITMDSKMLNMDWDLRWKIEELERWASHLSVFVREDEPYFEEIKELIKKKRQERIDELKKQLNK